ncbi:MAG: hypothetical protein WC276_11470 [Sedimentibacter sp.]
MEMNELLEKVRGLVPFIKSESRVEFGGACMPIDRAYISTCHWWNEWRERGYLLLNEEGEPVDVVIRTYSSSVERGIDRETKEYYPEGEAHYLLSYFVKAGAEEEEWAFLYRISEGGKKMEVKEKELEQLSREELLELVRELQKQVKYWRHRFNCVDREANLLCWHFKIPRI